jgi:hypothetical protein
MMTSKNVIAISESVSFFMFWSNTKSKLNLIKACVAEQTASEKNI